MKANRLFLGAAVALSFSSAPSFAGNPNIDQHMFHGRKEVQLIDESALFNDLRRQGNTPQTVIIEAPQQNQPAPPPLMIRPGMNPAGVTIMHSGLPDAGFQSAITPGNQARMAKNLPSGMSTNMLAGKMINQAPKSLEAKPMSAGSAPHAPLLQSSPKTLVYTNPQSSSGVSSLNAKTSVSATLQRGSLLANQAHH